MHWQAVLGTCAPDRAPAVPAANPYCAAVELGERALECAANDDDATQAVENRGFSRPADLPDAVVETPGRPCWCVSGWWGGTEDHRYCGQTGGTTSR